MPMKVYELAGEYQIEAKTLLNHLRDLGIFVSSHMSVLDEEEVAKVRATIAHIQKRQEITEDRIKPTVIRRRVVKSARGEAKVGEEKPEEAPTIPSEAEAALAEVQPMAVMPEAVEPVPAEEITPPAEAPRPKKRKKDKGQEAAVVIRKPESLPEPEQALEEAPPVEPEAVTQPAAEAEASKPEGVVGAAEMPEEADSKPKPPKAARSKKGKVEVDMMEPARIVARPKPELVRRLTVPTSSTAVVPPASFPPPALSEEELSRKARPKKRKALKAFEVITQEKPVRGRVKRKEVIQLRDEMEGRDRALRMGPRKKKAREPMKPEVTVPKAIKRKIRVSESISVGELAKRMGTKVADVIRKLLGMGMASTVNQVLEMDEASLVASEFGYEVEKVVTRAEELIEGMRTPEAEENLKMRPPVVTVMGHVDHGKTSLLDAIRKTHVTEQEVGGITQHIGAYQVDVRGHSITFLDTPGHEAFTSLRARGAKVTDVVVLVVAADDGVMNQTREAVDHARAAEVPIIVAINKIDKPNAEPERVKQELTHLGLVPESWGGDTIFCEVSAKQQVGIETLLENILIQAEVLELRANPDRPARGTVIEASLDKRRGPVATVLVQEGTLRPNDPFVAGVHSGKVRMILDHLGRRLEKAEPSTPVEVVGASGVPMAGERFWAVADDKEARDIEAFLKGQMREGEVLRPGRPTLDRLMGQMEAGELKELPVVVKGDVQGSIETLKESLSRLGGEKVKIQVIHASVGGITENDVNLASASKAIIIGFNVRPEPRAQISAEELGVEIRLYNIIYELTEDVEKALVGMLEPIQRENLLGRGEVIQLFKVSKVGTIAGTLIKQGRVVRGEHARLVRDGVVIYDGKVASLRRYQDDVKEAAEGQDCGIRLENFNDVKLGDVVEIYELEEVAPEL
jgi:translation initiation factor IF-2